MSSPNIGPPPLIHPVTDETGKASLQWALWLQGLRTGSSSFTVSTTSPVGTAGSVGQGVFDVTTQQLFICTTAGAAGTAVWTLVAGGGAAGVTSLNALVGALSITAGANITVTPSGSNIQIAASSATPGASASYVPTVTALTGAISASSVALAQFYQFGKWCYLGLQVTVTASSSSSPMQIGVSTPVNPANPFAIGCAVQLASSLLPIVATAFVSGPILNEVIFSFPSTNTVQYLLSVGGIYETV